MKIKKEDISAFVIAGGKSKRFRSDKALALYKGKTLLDHALETIQPLAFVTYINSKKGKYQIPNIEVIEDVHENIGPIAGLYSCIKSMTTDFAVIISVDTPLVHQGIYEKLISEYEDGIQALIPMKKNSYPEPLCGIYHHSILPEIKKAIHNEDYKLQNLISKLKTKIITINSDHLSDENDVFMNINYTTDLNKISKNPH